MQASLLDNDLYKFTMMQFIFHHFPNTIARYQFFDRTHPKWNWSKEFKNQLEEKIEEICQLKISPEELDYLKFLKIFSEDFLLFLKNFQLSRSGIDIASDKLIIEGKWHEVILWEVTLLAMICEISFASQTNEEVNECGLKNLNEKINNLKKHQDEFKFIDFGTRRRVSYQWQYLVNERLKKEVPHQFLGTSNLHIAQSLGLACYGTMGHEVLQAAQQLAPNFEDFQIYILKKWHEEFGEALAISLTDVLSTPSFLNDFRPKLAHQYKGIRIDSGNPFERGREVIHFYKCLGIDPTQKMITFSDSLNFNKARELHAEFSKDTKVLFGIGTYLTNHHGLPQPNVVIKLTHINESPVGKITDSVSKFSCPDKLFLEKLLDLKKKKESLYKAFVETS